MYHSVIVPQFRTDDHLPPVSCVGKMLKSGSQLNWNNGDHIQSTELDIDLEISPTELDSNLDIYPTELDSDLDISSTELEIDLAISLTEVVTDLEVYGKTNPGLFILLYSIITMTNGEYTNIICDTKGRPHDIFMRSHDTHNGSIISQ